MALNSTKAASEMRLTLSRDVLNPGRAMLGLSVVSWCFLTSPLLNAGPLALDEHGSYWIVDSDLPGTSLRRSLDYAAIPPLSSWLQGAFLLVLGKSEWAFRLSSALCFLAAIGLCYLAGKELRDGMTGGIAALIIVWHPEALDEVRIARCYGLVLCLGAVVLWTAIRWQRSPQSLFWAICWSLSGAALLWTHYTSVLLVAISGLGVAISVAGRRGLGGITLWKLLLAALLLAGLCLPLVPSIFRLVEWGPFLNYSGADATVWNVIGPLWWAGLPVAWGLTRILNRGASSSLAPKSGYWLTFACAVLPVLIFAGFASGEVSSLTNSRYRVAYAPAAACLIALLLTSTPRWRVSVAAAMVLLVVSWSLSPLKPWELGRLGAAADQDWGELNAHLASDSKPDEPILVQSGLVESHLVPVFFEDRLFMEYVACRVSRFYVETPHPRYALPYFWDERTGVVAYYRNLLDSWEGRSATFWVAGATDTDLNRNSLSGIESLAESAGFEAFETTIWPNATLIHYRPRRPKE